MRLFLSAILFFAAFSPAQAVEISKFRAGLACTNTSRGSGDIGWICHVAEDIYVTDQGECRYNGRDYLCTWVGFEFDYRGAEPGDALECKAETSQPMSVGNPREELAADSRSQEFSLPLKDSEGHFYNPQYYTFTTRPPEAAILTDKGHCSFNGKMLFEYTFRIHFPQHQRLGAGG